MGIDLIKDETRNGLKYLLCDSGLRGKYGLSAFFSTRLGGVSEDKYLKNLNLGFERNDKEENVINNYKIIANSQGFDYDKIFLLQQEHTDIIVKISDIKDNTANIQQRKTVGDAMVTNLRGILLSVRIADCVPILYFDEKSMSLGAAHCGWKGTYKNLQQKTALEMRKEYNADFDSIKIYIGAAISPCCYQVGEDFYNNFHKKFGDEINPFFSQRNNFFYCDLKGINKKLLTDIGIKEENIMTAEYCTCCNELFFSHRRATLNGTNRGSLAAFIGLSEPKKTEE